MAITNINVANGALIKLGEKTITTLADGTKASNVISERLEPCRRAVLRSHPWGFAIKRVEITGKTITGVADNGSGLIRITCVAHGFSTSDKVTVAGIIGTSEANTTWTITSIDADHFDLQGSTFVNTYISGGIAALAPAFDFMFMFPLPTDFLRVVLVNSLDEPYRIEGRFIVIDNLVVQMKYVHDLTDYDKMEPLFQEALEYYLAWDICYHITQNLDLKKLMLQFYDETVKRARFTNAAEGPVDKVGADEFLDSRLGTNRGFVRDPQT